MELTEHYTLPVSRERAWEALRDTAVLSAIIPGCESIEADGDNAYIVSMLAAVGPVKAHFKGRMSITDIHTPESYTVVFEGQGGVAGFAKGSAAVTLEADGESSTKLSYTAHAQVGGKLAQIGSRLVDGAARKVAGEFFKRFTAQMTGQAEAPTASDGRGDESNESEASVPSDHAAGQAPAAKGHKSWKAWISKS